MRAREGPLSHSRMALSGLLGPGGTLLHAAVEKGLSCRLGFLS